MDFDDQVASEQELIQRCLNGDRSAYRELYDQHKEVMYNVALRIFRNALDAEDALQESFVRIFKALPGFNGECQLSTWIYKILLNTCFSGLKKNKSSAKRSVALDNLEPAQLIAPKENPDVSIMLEQELGALPVGYRTIVILHEVEGFGHEEIAEMLEITVGTSKSQLFKAKKMLRKKLKPFFR